MKNWKTTLTGIGAAVTSTLTILAALPYQLGDAATVIPPEWKSKIVMTGLAASLVLRVLNSIFQKDAPPVAGTGTTMKLGLVVFAAGFLAGCVAFHFPIGSAGKFGSVDVTARYTPPDAVLDGRYGPVLPARANDGKAVLR